MIFDLLRVDFRHMRDEVKHLIGITPLVVVPGHEFEEVVVECDTGFLVEYRGAGVAGSVFG